MTAKWFGRTGVVSEEHFLDILERAFRRLLVVVQQMVKHRVQDLFDVGLMYIEHQLRLAQKLFHVEMCSDFGRKVFHRQLL